MADGDKADTRPEGQGSQRTAPTDEREEKQPETKGWTPLYSSNLVQYRYDGKTRVLDIIFKGNRKYQFRGVDRDTADGLGTSSSAGSYFNNRIKGKFPYSQGNSGEGGKEDDTGNERFRGAGATGGW